MGIARLKALTESEKDELVLMVLQQLTYQAKETFMKNEVINLGMIIKLIELSIATLAEAPGEQTSIKLEIDSLKLDVKIKARSGTDQIELDMLNNQQL